MTYGAPNDLMSGHARGAIPATVVPASQGRSAQDVSSFSHVQVAATESVTIGTTTGVVSSGSEGRKGDHIWFTSGTLANTLLTIISSAGGMYTFGQSVDTAPSGGDTFQILRFRLPVVDSDGAATASIAGVVQNTEVSYPSHYHNYYSELFGVIGIPTTTIGDPVTGALWSLTGGSGAVRIVGNTTDFSTETTLNKINGNITTCNTNAVGITSSVLPTGASTESTLSTLSGKVSAAAALSDSTSNPSVGGIQAFGMVYDAAGTRWSRLPGTAASGVLCDTELPAAAALTDSLGNPTSPLIGSCNLVWDSAGTRWSRWGGTAASGAYIQSATAHAASDKDNPVKIGGKARTAHQTAVTTGQRTDWAADTLGFGGVTLAHNNRSDTFTSTTNGTTIGDGFQVFKFFSIQVTMTGAVTSWTVVLEGSLDNTNFTTILSHTNVTPGDKLVLSTTNVVPVLYFRARCAAIVLGGGTNVVVQILGIQ